jgi:ABC-type multidrug transport system ATPase subunit
VVFLPDHPFLPKLRTGRELLLAVGKLYDIETERLFDHIERLLRLFQLESKGDSPIQSYSNGEQKKIAVCSALVTEAPVMLLDEPFSGGLDPSGLLALRRVLQQLAERKHVTVVISAPVPELLEGLAKKVAVLRDGKIAAYGTIDDLRKATGCSGTLAEMLEDFFHPQLGDTISKYLEGQGT